MIPRESNMTRVYTNACVQVNMRGRGLLRNTGVQRSEKLFTPLERGLPSKPAGRR
jgi:hypothetical protein